MHHETLLNVIPTDDQLRRLVVAIEHSNERADRLVLRQETYSDDVGWFAQSCIAIEPEQLPGLKMELTSSRMRKLQTPDRAVKHGPSILSFPNSLGHRVG